MTKTFSPNNKNDLYLGSDRNLVMTTGLFAVRDLCGNAAKTQLGEMYLYSTQGIPNFTAVWSGNANILQFEFSLRKTLLSVPDVVEITSLSIVIEKDILNYKATILTIYGSLAIGGSINGGI
jgi:hypothetical protein